MKCMPVTLAEKTQHCLSSCTVGRKALQAFLEAKHLAQAKLLDTLLNGRNEARHPDNTASQVVG